MANTHTTLSSLFTAIANSIRNKNGSTQAIVADTFPTEIRNLRTGFDYNNHNATAISDYEFYNCIDLKNVDCYNLTSIGTSAFEGCSGLKTVVLYEGVESIGENAFKGCSELTIYCYMDSQPDTWNKNWNPDNCEVIWCGGAVETWDVSATEEDNVTAKIYNDIYNEGYYLFVINGTGNMVDFIVHDNPLKDYLTTIKSVIIHGVVHIGGNTLYGGYIEYSCTSLTSIIIGDSVTSIGHGAFQGCSSLKSITIPNSVISIGNNAFINCSSLTSIVIPDSITSISAFTFSSCSGLTSITIPDSVTYIGNYAFNKCSGLTSITIPDSMAYIEMNTFYDCTSLASIIIPDSIIDIYYQAFYGCTSLASIIIPDSVTRIDNFAFGKCTSLASITYAGTIAQWKKIIFGRSWNDNTGNYTIHCTDGDIKKDGTITYHTTE